MTMQADRAELRPIASRRDAFSKVRVVEVPGGLANDRFADAVREGLTSTPKFLPCRFFYDEEGSRLFEEICGLPEYYLTRVEESILRRHRAEMVEGYTTGPTIVEMGSGSSRKTRWLLEAALRLYGTIEYVPIDVSRELLESSARELAESMDGLSVTALAGDYRAALRALGRRPGGERLYVFLGSSLGNYDMDEAVELLSAVRDAMRPGDRFVLGTDLEKDPAILEAAYDDRAGVTAAFNKNLLARINRELGGRFDLDAFGHRARYDRDNGRVEMHLVSLRRQRVHIGDAGLAIDFDAGEAIHTENSHKYTLTRLRRLAERSGFVEEAAWMDGDGWYRVQSWIRA